MSFVSTTFLVFLAVLFVVYYLVRPAHRWIVLLAGSAVFYLLCGWKAIFFILNTSLTIYAAARLIDKTGADFKAEVAARGEMSREDKLALREKYSKKKNRIFVAALIINLGVLAVVKYASFVWSNLGVLFEHFGWNAGKGELHLLVPIGLSFYTFQAIGYLIDVKRGKYHAERNYARFALFISFFPQIIQGPISRYDDLGRQLKEEHPFDYDTFVFGLQLMLWGFFKKMVIADRISVGSDFLFRNYGSVGGAYHFAAAVFYSIQIYMDFSGGIDITRGAAQALGIELPLNFERPFFSKTLSEFWRRWHITLGSWMRDYVFYSISLSSAWTKIGKWCRNKISKNAGKVVPLSLTSFVVFLLMGIWHGAGWNMIAFGLYNATIVSLSILCEPLFVKTNSLLKINEKCFSWRLFQMLRTTFICGLGRVIGHASDITGSFTMTKGILNCFVHPKILVVMLREIYDNGFETTLGVKGIDLAVVLIGVLIVLCVSILQERGYKIRETVANQNLVFRWLVWLTLIFIVLIFGVYGMGYDARSFIYGGY